MTDESSEQCDETLSKAKKVMTYDTSMRIEKSLGR